MNSQKAWLDAEKVWVVHKAGFSGGRVQKIKEQRQEDETPMCKVKLDHGGEIISIEEDSVEKVCLVYFFTVFICFFLGVTSAFLSGSLLLETWETLSHSCVVLQLNYCVVFSG